MTHARPEAESIIDEVSGRRADLQGILSEGLDVPADIRLSLLRFANSSPEAWIFDVRPALGVSIRRGASRDDLPRTEGPSIMPAAGRKRTVPTYDNHGQYSRTGILRYEKIFGHGYVSTGGPETTEYLCSKLGARLRPGVRVLDVGSGIGGAAFHLARRIRGRGHGDRPRAGDGRHRAGTRPASRAPRGP